MMNTIEGLVLDTSVAVAWGFEDEQNAYAEAVLRQVLASGAYVPAIWPLEIANALIMGERRNRIDEPGATRFTEMLAALAITIDPETSERAWHGILSLARRQNLTAYDASYLELAVRLAIPLATLDQRLRNAATSIGVIVYTAI